jgi:OmpA-OmpF porin, OOP family
MKRLLLILLITLSNLGLAQNLVPNPSFELIDSCNLTGGSLSLGYGPDWFSPSSASGSSPDLYNSCSIFSAYSVPTNNMGYQEARTGIGYAGIFLYSGADQQEYIECKLVQPLDSGTRYCVRFNISLANVSNYSIDGIGAFFSVDSLLSSNNLYFPVTPQVNSINGITISDTLNWVEIYGEYIASGGESFITIGHFKTDSNTNIDTVNNTSYYKAYYFIDDVSVINCDSLASVPDPVYPAFSLFPNPSTGEFQLQGNFPQGSRLQVYNLLGQEVAEAIPLPAGNQTVPIRLQVAEGIYVYKIAFGEEVFHSGRIVVAR